MAAIGEMLGGGAMDSAMQGMMGEMQGLQLQQMAQSIQNEKESMVANQIKHEDKMIGDLGSIGNN